MKVLKNNPQVMKMVCLFFPFDHEIVNTTFYQMVNDIIKYSSHGILVGGTSIIKAKMYEIIVLSAKRSYKRNVLLIFWCHLDMIITK